MLRAFSLPQSLPRGAERTTSETTEVRAPLLDFWLLGAALLLLSIGLLIVTSASMPIADRYAEQPFYYLIRQSIYVCFGVLLAAATLSIPLEIWRRSVPVLLLIVVLLLVMVLLTGKEINGSRRWLALGPINLQVSEATKLFAFIYVAAYLQRYGPALRSTLMGMMRPIIVLGMLAVLLLLEPDFGAAVVLMATALGMVFLAGVNVWQFAALQGLIITVMGALLYFSHYRWKRFTGFLDAWDDPFGSDFQLIQSLIAIGRGELLGVGLGASVQKLFYLPEAYTDFLFAILAEELGLVGVVVVIALYAVVVWRAFRIGAHAEWLEMRFAAFLAYGIGLWFGLQALVNMGVNMGVLPTKGLTLPLMSYGGSSMVVMCVAVGLLLRINLEAHRVDPRLQRRRACAQRQRS